MAIAITLLVLEVRVPTHSLHLARDLARAWPSYLAYGTSFLTIGIIWANHHRMFKIIERTTFAFLMINVLFLMVVAFIPFPTLLVAEYIRVDSGRKVALLVYGGTMTLTAIMFNLVWAYASKGGRMLSASVDAESIRKGTRSYRKGPVLYLAITLLALWEPYVSLALFMAYAVWWLFPSSGPGG